MGYRDQYLPLALDDMTGIKTYYDEIDCTIWEGFLAQIDEKIGAVLDNPEMYPVYLPEPSYRVFSVERYQVFYRVDHAGKRVIVSRIIHGARDILTILARRKQN